MKIAVFLVFFWGMFAGPGQSQDPDSLRPQAKFLKESVEIGEPVSFALYVRYPAQEQVLFPDSTASFEPFTLLKRDFFPTRTIGNLSRDCVVYQLATFLDDSLQTLRLPIYRFVEGDSLIQYSNLAGVGVRTQIRGALPEKPVFEEALSLQAVSRQINYPYILLGMGLVVGILLALNLFFDRPVQKFIFLFIESRRHTTFLRNFERLQAQLEGRLSVETMENLLNLWKKYIQRVDGKPYTSLTTQEIFKVLPDVRLREALQEVDRWIYGGMEMEDFRENVAYVRQISVQLYQKKREAIRNGKLE